MSRHHKPKAFWRLARIWFRHVRITVWLVILLLLVCLLYLHNIGLPGFAQRAVIRSFAARGITLDFAQLHLSWFTRIVAEDVSLQPSGSGWAPRIECRQVDLSFDGRAAFQLRIVPETLSIEDGRLILPFPQTNGVPGQMTATNLQALIRIDPAAGISLDAFRGEIEGCNFSASGTVVNPNLIQDWRILQAKTNHLQSPAYEIWRTVSEIRNEIEFLSPPELRLTFEADGADPESLVLQLSVKVDLATSPLGLLENPELSAHIGPLEDSSCSQGEIRVQADRFESGQGCGEGLVFQTTFSCQAESGRLLAGRATLSADQLNTIWAGAVDLEAAMEWQCDGTNVMPVMADLELKAREVSTGFARVRNVQAGFHLTPFVGDHRPILDLPSHLFVDLEPFELGAFLKAERVETPGLSATNFDMAVNWAPPRLSLTNLSADLAGGHLGIGADYAAPSGRLQFRAASDLDLKQLYPVLPQEAVEWLDFFTWKTPPVIRGVGALTLPEWSPHELLWPGNVQPSLYLNGQFEVGAGSYRRIPLSGASAHFTYSNMFWHLPDLTVRSGEDSLRLEHHNNDRTSEFIWKVDGAMDPTPALILLPDDATEARETLGTLHFGTPPEVHLEFAGRMRDLSTASARGSISLTNVAFRGQSFDELSAGVGFTNSTLAVSDLRVRAGEGRGSADSLVFNFTENLAFLSNGVSTLPPMTVATVIGTNVIRAIGAYQFLNPPEGRVEGVIPLKGDTGADLRFDLKGGPFEWSRFRLNQVEALVRWQEETVTVEIVQAAFYDGTASGQGFFDFTGKRDADFRFNLLVDDADLQSLVAGVFQSTNQLEGRLSGSLSITNGNTEALQNWSGYGYAKLVDGLIWSVPIFGIVSPVLDVFVPGLGNSRAREAEGRFVITNSVIRTEDLVIHTSNMRLLYAGTVDFKGQVDAVAEAEVLRDTFIVGELVSTALTPLSKAMIIEITGTLANPKARPLYVLPRLLLAPLNPVRMFKNMFAPAPKATFEEPVPAPPKEAAPPDPVDASPP